MKLLDNSIKTNWVFVIIAVVFGLVIGGLTFWYVNSISKPQADTSAWHEERLQERMPNMVTIRNTSSSIDYGIEKVIYTKASYNPIVFGLTKNLVIAQLGSSSKDTILQDVPDTSGLSEFILLPETKEAILAVPGVTTLQKIDFEKVNLETRKRIKLGTYEAKSGVELYGAIVSPDQKKLVFTTSGARIFLMDINSRAVPSKPIYTHSEGGALVPEVWDEKGNVYFKPFPWGADKTHNSPDYILQMNLAKKRLVFFRNIESYAFSPDKSYLAWMERLTDNLNFAVKVYSAKENAIWVLDRDNVSPTILEWRDQKHLEYRITESAHSPYYASVVYDVESHTKAINPTPPSYRVEGKIAHDIKIEEGEKRGSVENSKLYIDGVLVDSIQELSVSYGHSSAFEVLGFIHGKPIEPREMQPLYPSYLPEDIRLTEADKHKHNKCFGVICEMDIVGNFGVLRIRQFIDLESLYFPDDMIDDTATFRHLIREKKDVVIDGGNGTYFDLGTLPGERRLYFTKGEAKIQFFCYGGCTLSKDELLKIAQSMTAEEDSAGLEISTPSASSGQDWQTYRNEEFGFEVKYPLFFKPIEEDKKFLVTGTSFSYENSPERFRVEVVEKPLEELEYVAQDGILATSIYRFSRSKDGWYYVSTVWGEPRPEDHLSFVQEGAVPKKYSIEGGLSTWVGYADDSHHAVKYPIF